MEPEEYRERLAALREENEFLRRAAWTFGELAERLAHELRELRARTAARARNARDRNARTARDRQRGRGVGIVG
jgi:hypothetical protein